MTDEENPELGGLTVDEAKFEQPTMECPKCKASYPDFDGFGVVFCEACRFCQHLSSDGQPDGTFKCNFCGEVQS